ncbi:prolipoprotein diacylglyceryl transferase [bacterium]|nr:prolipoprotein diacylglyceryl transferase [bacterium]
MYPVIFKIGRFELHTYGVMFALAFTAAIIIAVRRGKKYGFGFDQVYNTSMIIILSSLIGTRLAYVVLHLDEFRGRWLDIINPFQSSGVIGIAGMVLLGGVIGGVIGGVLYLRLKKLSIGKMVDVYAPPLTIGIAIGRIGCFMNGCCFGKECHLPWGVVFPPDSWAHAVFSGAPVHPTQLYECLYTLLIFFVLLKLEKLKKFHGFIFAVFLILYGFFRIINESLRYYGGGEAGMIIIDTNFISLTFSQISSVIMIIIGLFIIITSKESSDLAKRA